MVTCEHCNCVDTGVNEFGEVVDYERAVEFLMEQLDFATDAAVEANNYWDATIPVGRAVYDQLTDTDRARLELSAGRLEDEVARLAFAH